MANVLRVDPIACDGYGQCAELLPELIDLDEWGYPIVSGTSLRPELEPAARRAVTMCPRLALTVVDVR
ncbi:MAG TPA: ferredoxin [Gaiellaceae bacterium]|nr:ferredoxin [Gaiellaceae bacterium]